MAAAGVGDPEAYDYQHEGAEGARTSINTREGGLELAGDDADRAPQDARENHERPAQPAG